MYQIDFHNPIHVHFIGIGGSSMSGLAELLHTRGFTVSGSDVQHSTVCYQLEQQGIRVAYGQIAENITSDINLIVYTAAIQPENPEFQASVASGIPMMDRAEFLGQLMKQYRDAISIAGTHGKTTTSSMLAMIFLEAKLDPTISLGAVLEPIHSSSRSGQSEHFVVESCEYKNSFLKFYPKHEIILNIEAEHLDFFHDLEDIRHSFRLFLEKLTADSHLVIQGDIERLSELTDGIPAQITTYGISQTADVYDYYASNLSYDECGCGSYDLMHNGKLLAHISLSVVGVHNISNSVAAAAMANLLGVPMDAIVAALHKFGGAKRRFENKGELGGITIIDDYAHHPTEIHATLTAAQNYPHQTLWCVFQPHTFSRTKALLDDLVTSLAVADKIVLADIYSASREKDPGDISSKDIQRKLTELGKNAWYFPSFDEIEKFLLENCTNGDLLITMGAGDIVKVGESLLGA